MANIAAVRVGRKLSAKSVVRGIRIPVARRRAKRDLRSGLTRTKTGLYMRALGTVRSRATAFRGRNRDPARCTEVLSGGLKGVS